tara:strand:- start:232 stop:750 length:519 start_codon:yes stop_codon:yes gene_type:complete
MCTLSHEILMMSLVGRKDEALAMQREVYAQEVSLIGKQDERNLQTALSLADMLIGNQDFAEALSLLRETIDLSRTVKGPEDSLTFRLVANYSGGILAAIKANGTADASDIFYAEKLLGENAEKARRILGPTRGSVIDMFRDLPVFRKIAAHIRATETPPYPSEVRFVVSKRT